LSLFNKIKIFDVKYADIAEIRLITFGESLSLFKGLIVWNKIVYSEAIFIKRRRYSLLCRFVITPDDPAHTSLG
jgi:hypothetical protein